jgi:hypothetical protein
LSPTSPTKKNLQNEPLVDDQKNATRKKHKNLQNKTEKKFSTSNKKKPSRHVLNPLQLRVVRAFRSNLEDLEDRRSIHSLRSLHNMHASQTPVTSSLLYANKQFLRGLNRDQSPPGNITIQVPTSPLNIHDMNARYIDDDGPDDRTGETRI